MLKLDSFLKYSTSDLELSKMTLRDLGPHLSSCLNLKEYLYSTTSVADERLRRYELGRMDTVVTVYALPNFFQAIHSKCDVIVKLTQYMALASSVQRDRF
jgi:hypothetical protein